MKSDDVVLSSMAEAWARVWESARRPALLVDADAGWLSQSLRVVCSRYTRVAESVDHARSRPTLSTKQNRYKYNQMSNKVNKLKRSREQWMVCVLEYCVKYLHIQLYKLIQRNKYCIRPTILKQLL